MAAAPEALASGLHSPRCHLCQELALSSPPNPHLLSAGDTKMMGVSGATQNEARPPTSLQTYPSQLEVRGPDGLPTPCPPLSLATMWCPGQSPQETVFYWRPVETGSPCGHFPIFSQAS